ncbi:MAG: MotA/TolQ/ExbB proton channel family protein [Bacteroidales bacterium]|nr:MotA/TolQ/ExbB proton channel family protein [Bacteroidales bacterium]
MKWFFGILQTGGIFFMSVVLIILLIILFLFVKGIIEKGENPKTAKYISYLGTFAIVWGILGQTVGMIEAFGVIEQVEDISPSLLAGGLKVSAYAPAFGFITFLISRIGKIVLLILKKDTK